MITQDLGIATAYGYAKSKGYTGTEAEFAELMASYASTAQTAIEAADRAVEANTAAQSAKISAQSSASTASTAAQTATSKASEAVAAAGTATTKASEASQSATSASQSAESAGTSAQTATTAASTANTKASEAAVSANTATAAKTDAETARDAAAQSASEAAASAESIDPATLEHRAYGAYVVESATGSIASFPDGADDIPMKDVLVHIELVQEGSGDPSPDNVRPITGWTGAKVTRTGKNLLNPSDPDYGNYTIEPDGATFSESTRIATGFIPCDEGVQLTFSTNKKTDGVGTDVQFAFAGIAAYDNDKNFITRATVNNQRIVTITTPAGTAYVRAFEQITGRGTSATITPADFATYEQQLELGSTATDYEPYSGQTYDITFPTEAGTVCGGTLDVTTGRLIVEKVIFTKNTATMNNFEAFPGWKNSGIRALIGEGISTEFTHQILNIGTQFAVNTTSSNDVLFLNMPTYGKNQTEWKALAQDVQICCSLAEPIIYQLTPQEITSLLGENNVWADTGDSEVEYRADTKMYITKKITEAVSALS